MPWGLTDIKAALYFIENDAVIMKWTNIPSWSRYDGWKKFLPEDPYNKGPNWDIARADAFSSQTERSPTGLYVGRGGTSRYSGGEYDVNVSTGFAQSRVDMTHFHLDLTNMTWPVRVVKAWIAISYKSEVGPYYGDPIQYSDTEINVYINDIKVRSEPIVLPMEHTWNYRTIAAELDNWDNAGVVFDGTQYQIRLDCPNYLEDCGDPPWSAPTGYQWGNVWVSRLILGSDNGSGGSIRFLFQFEWDEQ